MKRILVSLALFVAILGLAFTEDSDAQGAASTATPDTRATAAAYQTQIAKLDEKIDTQATSIAKRDKKITSQRTQIAGLEMQVADLQAQIPPTPTPTPVLAGKDAFPYVADANEIFTRPYNHLGEKMSFCGSVTFIQVAPPSQALAVGDTKPGSWSTVVQVLIDGYDVRFVAGFDGDTTGIYENSHVCVWGTLVDTFSGSNAFGGTITNPLFDAEYLELG